MSKKDDMVAALQKNLDEVKKTSEELAVVDSLIGPSDAQLVDETEEDYRYARERIKKLIETSEIAIDSMSCLAADAEHPRAFEVLGTLIKQAAEMNQQLLDLQKQRKTLVKSDDTNNSNEGASTTNNAIFVGTTSELQKFLKGSDSEPIDI
jgi:response regulator of citrate/malate metabolism